MLEEEKKRAEIAYGFITDICINKSRHASYQQQILLQILFNQATKLYKDILKSYGFIKQNESKLKIGS